jgi:Epoxide hydrolase N terminus
MDATPFRLDVPDAVLADLRERLARTRWPDEVAGAEWDYGVPLGYLRGLVEHWRTGFDWRGQERRINAFANYRADVGDLGVHFVHERGRGPVPLPLLLLHGWPSSFYEMLDPVPLLADPASHGGTRGTPSTSWSPRSRATASPTAQPGGASRIARRPRCASR